MAKHHKQPAPAPETDAEADPFVSPPAHTAESPAVEAAPELSPPHEPAAPVVLLWKCSTARQPILNVLATDAEQAKIKYGQLLGVRWFGNPVDVGPADADAVPSVTTDPV
jgi:hypothetical protein